MNTAKLTIDHHPNGDQCGDLMVTHAVHVEPVNIDAPAWVIEAATRHMCANPDHDGPVHLTPTVWTVIDAMKTHSLDTVVILGSGRWEVEDALLTDAIAPKIRKLVESASYSWAPTPAGGRNAVVVDLSSRDFALTTREQAWEAT